MAATHCASSRVRIARAQAVPSAPAARAPHVEPVPTPSAVARGSGIRISSTTRPAPDGVASGASDDFGNVAGAFEAAFASSRTTGVAGFMAAAGYVPGDVPAPGPYRVARTGVEERFVKQQMLSVETGASEELYDPLARLAPEPTNGWRAPQPRPLHPAHAEEEYQATAAAEARARYAAAPLSRAQLAAATAGARRRRR